MAARVTQALLVGGSIAVPDYVKGPKQQALATTALIAGGLGLIAFFNSVDEDPNNDPAIIIDQLKHKLGDVGENPGPDSDVVAGDLGGPLKTWSVLGAGVGTTIGLLQAERWIARVLREHGTKKPHTFFGLLAAATAYKLG